MGQDACLPTRLMAGPLGAAGENWTASPGEAEGPDPTLGYDMSQLEAEIAKISGAHLLNLEVRPTARLVARYPPAMRPALPLPWLPPRTCAHYCGLPADKSTANKHLPYLPLRLHQAAPWPHRSGAARLGSAEP